jgi:hypothetical protein
VEVDPGCGHPLQVGVDAARDDAVVGRHAAPWECERRRPCPRRRRADSTWAWKCPLSPRDCMDSTSPASHNTDNARCAVFLLTRSAVASDRTEAATVSPSPCARPGDATR